MFRDRMQITNDPWTRRDVLSIWVRSVRLDYWAYGPMEETSSDIFVKVLGHCR